MVETASITTDAGHVDALPHDDGHALWARRAGSQAGERIVDHHDIGARTGPTVGRLMRREIAREVSAREAAEPDLGERTPIGGDALRPATLDARSAAARTRRRKSL